MVNSWSLLGEGLPNVPVIDIRLHNPTRTIIAATFGRSMYKVGIENLTSVKKVVTSTENIKLDIYPNPLKASSRIYLELSSDQSVFLSLVDSQGKLLASIFNGNLTTGKHVFDLPQFNNAATFFCVLKTSDTTISKQIVKTN